MALLDAKGVVPLSTWILISNFKLSYHLLRGPDGSFNRLLAEFLDRKVPANATPVDGVATADEMIDPATGLWCRLFWSESPDYHNSNGGADGWKPVLIYFHGGSFVHSSANSSIYDAMCRCLARLCGVVIVLVNFRRAPEHKYPAAYEDGLLALRWAKSAAGQARLAQLGANSDTSCYLAGDSSGGNMVHHVAIRAAIAPDAANLAVTGMLLLMPMFGGEPRTAAERLLNGKYFVTVNDRDWYWRAFLPVGAHRDHPACNPFSRSDNSYPAMADICLPPSLTVIGGFDLLQDWQINYVHSLQRAGHSAQLLFLEQATMGFFLLPNSDLFYTLIKNLRQFIDTNCHH